MANNGNNEVRIYQNKDLYARAIKRSDIPKAMSGCSRNGKSWARETLNMFIGSGEEAWDIERTDRGPIKTKKDASSAANRLREAAKRLNYPVIISSRLDHLYIETNTEDVV